MIRDGKIKYQLHSKNNSLLIGKNGHILESIQTYVRQAILLQLIYMLTYLLMLKVIKKNKIIS